MRWMITFGVVAVVAVLAVFHGSWRTSYAAASSTASFPSSSVGIVCNLPKRVVRVAPSACDVLPRTASFAEGIALVGLRWRGWGQSSATGTGFETGFHLPLEHNPVAVVAYQLVHCSDGTQLYTRVRSSSRYGTMVVRAEGCLAPAISAAIVLNTSIGPVKVGDSLSRLRTEFPVGACKTTTYTSCTGRGIAATIAAGKSSVTIIQTTAGRYRTAPGIGVGSTVAELLKAYPQAIRDEVGSERYVLGGLCPSLGKANTLFFTKGIPMSTTAVVSEIVIEVSIGGVCE